MAAAHANGSEGPPLAKTKLAGVEGRCSTCAQRAREDGRRYVASLFYDGLCSDCGFDRERSKKRKEARESAAAIRVMEKDRSWRAGLVLHEKGYPLAILANAKHMLVHHPDWAGRLSFDEFASAIAVRSPTPICADGARYPRPWIDVDDINAACWFQNAERMNVNKRDASNAVIAAAREHRIHPVRSYLDSLHWDGSPRIDTWLIDYLGAADDPQGVTRAIGRCWLMSACARVRAPGCKVDCVLLLEGEQGTGKSTAISVLAGDWFGDELAEIGSKDAALQLQGVWIVELAELDATSKADVERVKAFVSRSTDRFRAPYGVHTEEHPRQCVFAGTTNRRDWNKDHTGARRFLPVECGSIDMVGLRTARDGLFAEADARVRGGERYHIEDVEVMKALAERQEERFEEDPWEETITTFLAPRKATSMDDVLTRLGIEESKRQQRDVQRVGKILHRLKWVKRQFRRDGKRVRGYVSPPHPVTEG